jgi:hypothetical protein
MLGTNLCQIITPVLVLFIVLILKEVSKSNIEFMAEFSLYLPVPFIFHIPYEPLSNFGKVFNITECDQWYFYEFKDTVTQEDKDFFGYNSGMPMGDPKSDGVLSSDNVITFPCAHVGKTTPWFKEYK